MDGIQDNSLFRPIPIAKLQSDLAGFYSKTSRLVKEKFEDMVQFRTGSDRSSSSSPEETEEQEQETFRVPGLGRLIDIYA
jgi:hypothetical protein